MRGDDAVRASDAGAGQGEADEAADPTGGIPPAGSGRLWRPEEDARLRAAVDELGPHRWSLIAARVGTRNHKQARERWFNHLRPNVNKATWTAEEDAILLRAVAIHGTVWSKIGQVLQGRSDHWLKNRFNSLVRKRSTTAYRPGRMSEWNPTDNVLYGPGASAAVCSSSPAALAFNASTSFAGAAPSMCFDAAANGNHSMGAAGRSLGAGSSGAGSLGAGSLGASAERRLAAEIRPLCAGMAVDRCATFDASPFAHATAASGGGGGGGGGHGMHIMHFQQQQQPQQQQQQQHTQMVMLAPACGGYPIAAVPLDVGASTNALASSIFDELSHTAHMASNLHAQHCADGGAWGRPSSHPVGAMVLGDVPAHVHYGQPHAWLPAVPACAQPAFPMYAPPGARQLPWPQHAGGYEHAGGYDGGRLALQLPPQPATGAGVQGVFEHEFHWQFDQLGSVREMTELPDISFAAQLAQNVLDPNSAEPTSVQLGRAVGDYQQLQQHGASDFVL